MKRLTIIGSAVVVVLIVAWIVYRSSRPQGFAHPVPTSCPALKTIKCPGPGDVDANGCPKGGYDASTGECVVTLGYYREYGGCTDEHHPMVFRTKASPGNPSKYHLVSGIVFDIQAAFTEIDCISHVVVGPINGGSPFLRNFNDDFSDFKPGHISDDANPASIGKCFKVTVNPSTGDCIDPHIIIRGG
jgi:hypothetical protein